MENQIIVSGKKLFYKNGYFKTKITDITEEIGVSTGNFYTHYSSKEVLLDKILRDELKVLNKGFKIAVKIDGNLSDVLTNFFSLTLVFIKNMMPLYILKREIEENIYKFKETTVKLIQEYNELLGKYIEIILIRDVVVINNLEIIKKLINAQVGTYISCLMKNEELEYLHKDSIKKHSKTMTTLAISTCNIFNLTFEKKNKYDRLTGVYSEEYFFEILQNIVRNKEENNFLLFVIFPGNLIKYREHFFFESILKEMSVILKSHIKSKDIIGVIEKLYFVVYMNKIHDKGVIESIENRLNDLFEDIEKKYLKKDRCVINVTPIPIKEQFTYEELKADIYDVIEKSKEGENCEQ